MLKLIRCTVEKSYQCTRIINDINCQSYITKRWAGHSKWANIKHQKTANDIERNKLFTKLSRMIRVAIIEGKDPNPETNSRLQSIVGQCKRANMPASSITNSIKSATSAKSAEKTIMFQVRGPGRCALLIEAATANTQLTKNNIASIMKKHGCKYENVNHDFSEKGVLMASRLNESQTADEAMEHAIEASVEEVTLEEETKKLRFECSPEITWKAKKSLEASGYVIDSALIEFLPQTLAELSDDEIEVVSRFIEKVEALPEVMKITDNIA